MILEVVFDILIVAYRNQFGCHSDAGWVASSSAFFCRFLAFLVCRRRSFGIGYGGDNGGIGTYLCSQKQCAGDRPYCNASKLLQQQGHSKPNVFATPKVTINDLMLVGRRVLLRAGLAKKRF